MKLLFTYEDRDKGEEALARLVGEKRLASERDDTATVYNLFGEASWGNLYRLGLYNLNEFETLIQRRAAHQEYDKERFVSLLSVLQYVAKQYDLQIPSHWL